MAFTMHLLRSYNYFVCCIVLNFLPIIAYGDDFSAEVSHAEVVLQNDDYVLSAQINYHLSEKAKTALQNGVPLYWHFEVKLQQVNGFFGAKSWVVVGKHYRLQYHALLNMYRLKNEDEGVDHNFSSLASALELMSEVTNLPIIKKSELDSEHQYTCLVKLAFERDALPLPLRPFAYIDPQWYLSSDWTEWPLKK